MLHHRNCVRAKDLCRAGTDPMPYIVYFKTGVTPRTQREEDDRRGPPSIEWSAAKTLFLDFIFGARRRATVCRRRRCRM